MIPGSVLVGDVCVHRNDGRLVVVTEIRSETQTSFPLLFVMAGGSGSKYKGRYDEILGSVGYVDLEKWEELKQQSGSIRFTQKSFPNPWKFVVGQKIKIRTSRGVEEVTFEGYVPRRHRYPISYKTASGKAMKCSASLLVQEA